MARILYLDDEQAIVLLMTRMLEVLGHRVAGYSVPADALMAFQAHPASFDLIISDLSMPGTSGLEFARQVLSIRPEARVALMSGYVDPQEAEAARALGVLDVVIKPHSVEGMSRTLGELSKKAPAVKRAEAQDGPSNSLPTN